MKKIAIFASGSGSNAQRITEYFLQKPVAKVEIILSNRKNAFVLERAKSLNVPVRVFDRDEFYNTDCILQVLRDRGIDLVVLAGFLLLVPENILRAYPNRIVNIHPALLPKYGGKGMYGMLVHESVVANKESSSGITIHYVNEQYDRGDTIFQAKCDVEPDDTAEAVAQKIHALEYEYFPKVIEEVLQRLS